MDGDEGHGIMRVDQVRRPASDHLAHGAEDEERDEDDDAYRGVEQIKMKRKHPVDAGVGEDCDPLFQRPVAGQRRSRRGLVQMRTLGRSGGRTGRPRFQDFRQPSSVGGQSGGIIVEPVRRGVENARHRFGLLPVVVFGHGGQAGLHLLKVRFEFVICRL